jgi:dihydroorotate dehydrogenase electron transfer subunit
MKVHVARIAEIIHLNRETCLRLETGSLFHVNPGQFFQAFADGTYELLPSLLFPCAVQQGDLLFCGAIPVNWLPGTELHIRGPRGNGFHLPPMARRVALTTLDQLSINRLLPLANAALTNGAEVTILTGSNPSQLAPEIEVLSLSDLGHMKVWADYLAAALPLTHLAMFNQSLDLTPGKALPFASEVMVDSPMICDENSACGVCAVFTSKGWKLACKDGPVFQLDELVSEELPHG